MRKWLENYRVNQNMTHEQVADSVDISRSYYTNIENGVKTPSVKVAKALSGVLKFEWELFYKDG